MKEYLNSSPMYLEIMDILLKMLIIYPKNKKYYNIYKPRSLQLLLHFNKRKKLNLQITILNL